MSTGQTLRVCGAALPEFYLLQLPLAGTHRLEPLSSAAEYIRQIETQKFKEGKKQSLYVAPSSDLEEIDDKIRMAKLARANKKAQE